MHERILGTTNELLELARSEEVREHLLALAQLARHSLDIVSRHLDPVLYNNAAFADAVRAMIVDTRRAQVRLLVLDPAPLVNQGHRLLELARHLTSFITVRTPAPEHKEFNEAWLVADNTGYLHRRFSDRYEATANFADRRQSNSLTHRFEDLWQRAEPASTLRRLHL